MTNPNKKSKRLRSVWQAIKSRCYNPDNYEYYNYGGRGIKMCESWFNDFQSFYDWAFSNGYDENAKYGECTIDRIDVNGDYEPDNCRWVSLREQAKNRQHNRFIEFNGEKQTLEDWGRITGIDKRIIHRRLKNGWSVERALTEKPFLGKNQTYAKESGVKYGA